MCSLNTIVIFVTCLICFGNCLSTGDDLDPTNKAADTSQGIFEKFIENYLDILSTAFTGKELIRYCRMMRKELEKMEFSHTQRLARHYKHLSKLHRDDIVDEVAKYRREYNVKLPKRQDFFLAIDEAFNLQHRLKFNDYLHDLLAFGKGDLLFVTLQEDTRKLLDMIVDCVSKLGTKTQKVVEKTMKEATKEHMSNFYA